MADKKTTCLIYNMDILVLAKLYQRFVEELKLSQSSTINSFTQADYDRLNNYLDTANRHIDHFIAQPLLDTPESHPSAYELPAYIMADTDIENTYVFYLCTLISTGYHELVRSQSARLANTLIPPDITRSKSIIEKAKAYMTNLVPIINITGTDTKVGLDLPESSPKVAMVDEGK